MNAETGFLVPEDNRMMIMLQWGRVLMNAET